MGCRLPLPADMLPASDDGEGPRPVTRELLWEEIVPLFRRVKEPYMKPVPPYHSHSACPKHGGGYP